MPDENDLLVAALKQPRLYGNPGSHDQAFFDRPSLYNLKTIPDSQPAFDERLYPNESDVNVEDRRGEDPPGDFNMKWNKGTAALMNLLKYGKIHYQVPMPTDTGGRLIHDAGFYDIGPKARKPRVISGF